MWLLEQLEPYITDFQSSISILDFLFNVVVATLLALLLRTFYIFFGQAVSNRRQFAHNFLPLALGTMLIITVVKSSIMLSLGLVGALSIVRFRAAIKDPEELTFLFLVIGIGVSTGANQSILALIAIPIILGVLLLYHGLVQRKAKVLSHRVHLHIQTDEQFLESTSDILSGYFKELELTRMDNYAGRLELHFTCLGTDLKGVEAARQRLLAQATNTRFSLIESPR